MPSTLRAADSRRIHTWDSLVLFWVVLWIVLGAWTGYTLWKTADTGDTITGSADALSTVGEALQDLSALPLIPERPGEIGGEVTTTATEIAQRGQEIKGQLRQLGLLLGIAIVGIPVSPVLGLYLPLRMTRRREIKALRREIGERPDDAGLDRYLAHHARMSLSYAQVEDALAESDDGASEAELNRALADAELHRLGLRRPSPV